MADNDDKEKRNDQRGGDDDGGQSLAQMNKEIEQYQTDPLTIDQIKADKKNLFESDKPDQGENPLELFKLKYETLYNSLTESYQHERHYITKCKEFAQEITVLLAKLDGVYKMIQANEDNLDLSKKDLEEKRRNIEKFKDQKEELEVKIEQAKVALVELSKQSEKILDDVDKENEQILHDKQKEKEENEKINEQRNVRIKYLKNEQDLVIEELRKEQERYNNYLKEVEDKQNVINDIKEKTMKQEKRKKDMDSEMEKIKEKIDKAKEDQKTKKEIIRTAANDFEIVGKKIQEKMQEKDKLREQSRSKLIDSENYQKDIDSLNEAFINLEANIQKQYNELKTVEEQRQDQEQQVAKLMKDYEILVKKKNQIITEKENYEREKLEKEEEEKICAQAVAEQRKLCDKIKEETDDKLKVRTQNNKLLKKAEDEEHNMDENIIYQLNKLKKIENQVFGYEIENEKLKKIITQLQKEQEKYGIEASQAHAKYYQTIEEVKIKNNQITELQKKNAEVEAKLKHQQNLYEAVRSDRNLYSKNLLESQEEIQELTKKYTRMTHQVDQFKEEIKTKDQQLVKQDFEFNKIVDENKKTKLEKERVKKAIVSTEEVIKNQEQHISRLKYIIQEAKAERQRQEKDLEMVINERDILGTQLIKRNQELNILYEKIKLNQSNLAKGEIFYREKQNELESLQRELTNLINELKGTQEQIKCIDDLKNEINSLEKDILAEKTKVKALQDELENPLNVHRWRKLEATDQENFERILKIQTLQRRLIAKTEEVDEKENLIKEKEKLFMELKNILARQPGAEIHQQLETYKESLKEKVGQSKKMNNELKNAQEQVSLLKFDKQRLVDELNSLKMQYFKKRREEDRAQEAQNNPQLNEADNYLNNNSMPNNNSQNNMNGNGMMIAGSGSLGNAQNK